MTKTNKLIAVPDSVWKEYISTKSTEIRDKLVESYLPLVNIIAGRLAISLPPHVDREDLISSGFFGLLDAIDRYDLSRGNKFETYAGVRIRGSMLDYLRSKDWLPVSLRQKIRRYEQTISKLDAELGRPAEDSEVAQELGMTIEELNKLVARLGAATVIPLDDYIRMETPDNTAEDPTTNIETVETKEILAQAIDNLPEKERLVVSLYYHEELTMKEISLIMNLSEARICQLHTKAIFRLRGSLARVRDGLV